MRMTIHPNIKGAKIDPNIYGHFAEHLGNCIYGGLYVGEDSPIPNVEGMRKDVLEALRKIRIPVLRWPGGCFADEYHWRDGIGPREKRKKMVNNNWGGVVEDNSFGTHEFLRLCELLGCEPYVNGNVGSGSVEEMQAWVEYMTSGDISPMADLRRENGRDEPWKLTYFGVGNENWGCGGNMRPAYYADVYRRYQTYVRNCGDNKIVKIACGAGTSVTAQNLDWTQTLMDRAAGHMDALTLHYYTILGDEWNQKGSATEFNAQEYYKLLGRAQFMEPLLKNHEAIMDRYDPARRIALIVDEWGTWFDVEPGTNPGFLRQQSTMRDAQVAAITLNIFNKHAARVRMANLAQTVNVLQAVVMTEGDQMILTPTYHVFDLFSAHQGGTQVHTSAENTVLDTLGGPLPQLSESASVDAQGTVHLTVANVHEAEEVALSLRLDGGAYSFAGGRLLHQDIHAKNTFDQKECVSPKELNGIAIDSADSLGTEARCTLPPCSVLHLRFTPA